MRPVKAYAIVDRKNSKIKPSEIYSASEIRFAVLLKTEKIQKVEIRPV